MFYANLDKIIKLIKFLRILFNIRLNSIFTDNYNLKLINEFTIILRCSFDVRNQNSYRV